MPYQSNVWQVHQYLITLKDSLTQLTPQQFQYIYNHSEKMLKLIFIDLTILNLEFLNEIFYATMEFV